MSRALLCRMLLPLASQVLLVGCGAASLSHTVKDSHLREMSREGQVWIYDAENEIVVALDRLDDAKDTLVNTRRRLREAERAVSAAEERKSRLGVEVAEAWLAHLEALEEWAQENIRLQQHGVLVARAAVELAKAQVIHREDLLGGKDFSIGDYQEQYKELKDENEAQARDVDRLRKEARQQELRWWNLRRRFVAQTGDYDSGLWID